MKRPGSAGHSVSRQCWALASLAVITPAGFYSKFYSGPGAFWANNSFAGALYVAFWCLAAFLFWPRRNPAWIAAIVLTATCALEFLQLWHPPALQAVRGHFLGAAILGTTFVWSDFPYYFLGAALGWLVMRAISARCAV